MQKLPKYQSKSVTYISINRLSCHWKTARAPCL